MILYSNKCLKNSKKKQKLTFSFAKLEKIKLDNNLKSKKDQMEIPFINKIKEILSNEDDEKSFENKINEIYNKYDNLKEKFESKYFINKRVKTKLHFNTQNN
jgi:hypothetical protein